ncbi:hypothetical protein MFIFM68171_03714 [Madurella fahalii]|uniref:Heterokaryon incompatibility domain-containing protein n=1 Tax=Madurella fahalii TaxID=1157608 RepID=A0ABQ0G6W3_9PEZI
MSQRAWDSTAKTVRKLIFGDENTQDEKHPAKPKPEDRTRNQIVTENYIYAALTSGPKSIRLLELLPGTRQDDIACILTECSLDSRVGDYDALSYVWGDATKLTPIQINGRTLMVTENLRTALLNIRKLDRSYMLWVDAVCIDQNTVQERNHQVSIMGEIYRNAARTIVWMGDNRPPFTERVYAMVDELAAEAVSRQHTGVDIELNGLSLPLLDAGHIESPLFDRFKEDFTILHLAHADWWFRAWTVQELLLASQALVMTGTFTMDWDRFSQGVDYGFAIGIWNPVLLGIMVDPIVMPYLSTRALRKRRRPSSPANPSAPTASTAADALLELLIKCRFRQASDPRDKVYALLGLLDGHASTLGIEPEYGLSTSQLYRLTARQLLLHSDHLDLLGARVPTTNKELPSWVPDWSVTASGPQPLAHDARGRPRQTHASRGTRAAPRFLGDDGDILVLEGHELTSITDLSPVLHHLYRDSSNFPIIKRGDTLLERLSALGQLFTQLTRAFWELSAVIPHLATFSDWEAFARASPTPPSQDDDDDDHGSHDDHDEGSDTPTRPGAGTPAEGGEEEQHAGYDPLAVYWQTLCAGTEAEGGRRATAGLFYAWRASLRAVFELRRWRTDSLLRPLAFVGYLMKTWHGYSRFAGLLECVYERRLGRGEDGLLALLPAAAEVGDRVVLVKGGRVPLVLRHDGERGYRFVGEAYVHGAMDGEMFVEGKCKEMRIC